MRVGVWCPAPLSIRPDAPVKPAFEALTRHGGGVDKSYLYAVDVVRRAEQIGFEITLIAQRFFGPDLDSWMLAAALAAQTSSIEIMAAVHPGIIDPKVVAKQAASIDRISGGRFCVNIVNGSRPEEFEVFGKLLASGEARYRRMHEFIQVLKGMWFQDDFMFEGEFYSVAYGTVPTKSVRVPHPPIYAVSRVDQGMNVVAQECDVWFVNGSRHYREYEEGLKRIEREVGLMEQRCREFGRKMRYGISACVLTADTDQEQSRSPTATWRSLRTIPRSSRPRSQSVPTSSARPEPCWSESADTNRLGSICSCCNSIRCGRGLMRLPSRSCPNLSRDPAISPNRRSRSRCSPLSPLTLLRSLSYASATVSIDPALLRGRRLSRDCYAVGCRI